MAAKSTLSASITFGGFPIAITAYNVLRSKSADSFKTLCECHKKPIKAPKTCSVTGKVVPVDAQLKGVELGKGDVREIPADALEAMAKDPRSLTLTIVQLPPATSIATELATSVAHFRIVPNEKVPGSEQPVQILWNGLMAEGRALITEWVVRAGSKPALIAIVADETGLLAHALPYVSDLQETPTFAPVKNEQAAQMFAAFAGTQGIDMGDFDHAAHVDRFAERKMAVVQAALKGEKITVAGDAPAAEPVPDLMAAMAAALDAAKATPAKKRAPAKAKKDPVAA